MSMEQFEPVNIIPLIYEVVNDEKKGTKLVYVFDKASIFVRPSGCDFQENKMYFKGKQTVVVWNPVYYCTLEEDSEGLRIYLNYNIYLHIEDMTKEQLIGLRVTKKMPEEDFHFNYCKKTVAESLYFDVQYKSYESKYSIDTRLARKEEYWSILQRTLQRQDLILSFIADNIKFKAEKIHFQQSIKDRKRTWWVQNDDFMFEMDQEIGEVFYMNRFGDFGMVHFVYDRQSKQFEVVMGNRLFLDLYHVNEEEVELFREMSMLEDNTNEKDRGHKKISGDDVTYI